MHDIGPASATPVVGVKLLAVWDDSARPAQLSRPGSGQHVGRPKALDAKKAGLAQGMHASGESASTIAATLGVSRATVYRALADVNDATAQ